MRNKLDRDDLLKTCVSVPGVDKRLMDQYISAEEGFQSLYCFHEKEQDLVHLFRDNVTGGPSIVFKREVKGQDGGWYLGWDANAMYSWVMMHDMPTGPAI